MGRVRKAGSVITGRFLMADTDPDRAAQTLQAALEKVLLRSPEIVGTPEILETHSLQPPEPLELNERANPIALMWREYREQVELRLVAGGRDRGI